MKHTIALDRGNTATKAALYEGNRMVDMATSSEPRNAVEELLQRNPVEIEAAIYSTVGKGGDAAISFLKEYAERVVSLHDDIALPITIPKQYRSTLGTDRIASAAGAYRLFPGCNILVVDSGTAVTYDYVSSDGVFVGGNIAPGIRMSLNAMHQYTALLPQVEVPENVEGEWWGEDTGSAMIKGVIYGIVGNIESLCRRMGEDTRVVITGGTSPLFIPLLRVVSEYSPHLVVDGLNYILTR